MKLAMRSVSVDNHPMRLIFQSLASLTLVLALAGCNVFFATESVELGDPVDGSGDENICTDDCERVCDANCDVECRGGATCDITLENGGSVVCAANSNCNVQCDKGDCEVTCKGACNLECGPNAGACGWESCDGVSTQCGARGLACDSDCP